MILKKLNPLHYSFKVGGLKFKATDFDDYKITFVVRDEGDLKVGEFSVEYDDDGRMEFSDPPEYDQTLERLRQSGDSDAIARQVKKTISSLS